MLHHIVLMKFKPDTSEEDVDRLAAMLDALPGTIIEIQTYEFGRDIARSERSYDFALVSGFANMEAMQRYQVHPDHQKVVAHIRAICDDIRAVDFNSSYTPPEKLADPALFDGFKMP
ncbi:MAG: Dabb family protein [Deltaproteobacteria bacterium]|jgi:quinol monooxygenase YgiN|nr:Dabb family protein [Deltaproteobacteria bacterium]